MTNPALIVAIVGGFCVLLVYSLSSLIQAEAPIEIPAQYEAELLLHDRAAIEAAYRQHVQSVFLTWMKDPSGQPGRAVRGVDQARRAYVESMRAIEERTRKQETKP